MTVTVGRHDPFIDVTRGPYNARGDGVTDDTSAIAAAISAAGINGVLLFPDGTYLITGLTASVAGQRWTGPGVLTMANSANTHAITVSASDVTIDGIGIDGNHANQSSGNGIYIGAGLTGVTVRNVVIDGPEDCGVRVKSVTGAATDHVVIEGCTIIDAGEHAIWGNWEATHMVVRGNLIDGTRTSDANGIWIGNDSDYPIVEGNTIRNAGRMGIEIWECDHGTVANNIVTEVADFGISYFGDGGSVTGNTVDGFGGIGIELAIANWCSVAGNTIDGQDVASTLGMFCSNATNTHNTISGNAIRRCVDSGIKVQGGDGYAVTGNAIDGCGQGIYLNTTVRSAVSGNTVTNGDRGVQAFEITDTAISGNMFDQIVTDGILVWNDSGVITDVSITGNICDPAAANRIRLLPTGSGSFGAGVVLRGNPGVSDYLDYANILGEFHGTGTPEGVVTAGIGSMFHRRDGGASTSLYIKTSGVGNTGWTAK